MESVKSTRLLNLTDGLGDAIGDIERTLAGQWDVATSEELAVKERAILSLEDALDNACVGIEKETARLVELRKRLQAVMDRI